MSTRRKLIVFGIILIVSIVLAAGGSDVTGERSDGFRDVMNTLLVLLIVGGIIYFAVSLAIRNNRAE